MRKFQGVGELERTGYIPEGSADEREFPKFTSQTHRDNDPKCPCNECQFSRQPE